MAENLELIFLPKVAADIGNAFDWYEQRSVGLGDLFLRRLDEAIARIRKNPEMFAVAYRNYRRVSLRRFPYVVFFRHTTDSIFIHGVFHCSQDASKWQSRLP